MEKSFAKIHPELVSEWSEKNLPLTADDITYGSNKLRWWKGVCGHEWQASPKSRSVGEKCPVCSGARAVPSINDLATLKPELISEWSPKNKKIKPTMVTVGSNKKIIWKGKCGHEWIAICNQKGGVGKTTTTVNLGIGLAMQGKRVLLVDADPQSDLTACLGWANTDGLPETLSTKLLEVIRGEDTNPLSVILHHNEGVDLVPANLDLSAMEMSLVTAMSRETALRRYLTPLKQTYG